MSNPVVVGMVVLYFLVVLAIGAWASQRQKREEHFIIGGRQFSALTLALAMTSTVVSGFAFIGLPGLTYAVGYAPIIGLWCFGGALSFLTGYLVLARPLNIISRKYGVLTVPDLFELVYESRQARIASTVVIFVVTITFVVVQWQAIGRVTQVVLGVDFATAVLIGAGIVALYSIAGGMMSAIYTDVVQMILMYIAAITVFVVGWFLTGGLTATNTAITQVNPSMVEPWLPTGGFAVGFILSYLVFSGICMMGVPAFATKLYAARRPSVFRWAALICTVSYGIMVLEWFTGIFGRALVVQGKLPQPAAPDVIAPLFVNTFLPPLLAGLVFAGVLAAMMSTVDSYLIVVSAVVVRDFVGQILGVQMEPSRQILWLRITTAVIAIVSVFIATNSFAQLGIVALAGFSLTSTSMWPAMALGVRWKRATREGAVAALWIGFLVTAGILLTNALFQPAPLALLIDASVVGFLAGVGALVVVSLLTPARERKVFRDWPRKAPAPETARPAVAG
ncbi:MAG: hypothetical protein HY690_07635 [Chloroflexi bacterium]|nr:hypothetical protein [Chloroflexota bacterium]